MLLENLSYPQVEDYLKEKDIILIPIGSVEQHSPYGLIGTDFITAQEIAKLVGEKLNIIVAPVLTYGMSQHHMGFKGSATLSPITYVNVIKEITKSFLNSGFRKVVYINGHGGNINPAKTAFDQLKYEGNSGLYEIISWFLLDEVLNLAKELFGNLEGHHATPSEVSITKYLRDYAFEGKPTEEKDVEVIESYWPMNKLEMKTVYPDGRMSSAPWLSNKKYGKQVLDVAVDAVCKKVKNLMEIDVIK